MQENKNVILVENATKIFEYFNLRSFITKPEFCDIIAKGQVFKLEQNNLTFEFRAAQPDEVSEDEKIMFIDFIRLVNQTPDALKLVRVQLKDSTYKTMVAAVTQEGVKDDLKTTVHPFFMVLNDASIIKSMVTKTASEMLTDVKTGS